MSGTHTQKLLNHRKKSAADALKTSLKQLIQKTAESTSDFIGNKNGNKITKISKNSQNNSETVSNENDKEIPKDICISRTKTRNYWWTKIKIIQKNPEMRMMKKYLKKDIYLQKKDRKLLINWEQL